MEKTVDILVREANNFTEDQPRLEMISEVFLEDKAAVTFTELANLFRITKQVMRLEGDIAELGVYKGGSAKLLALASGGKKRIHLLDTFAGIPEATDGLDTVRAGDFKSSLEGVQNYLLPYPNIFFYPGFFPQSIAGRPDFQSRSFALVNLDVDTYVSTLQGLEFFYPRMNRGGVIIIHDYNCKVCLGVKKAVDEFFADKPETLIELWATQVVISKC